MSQVFPKEPKSSYESGLASPKNHFSEMTIKIKWRGN